MTGLGRSGSSPSMVSLRPRLTSSPGKHAFIRRRRSWAWPMNSPPASALRPATSKAASQELSKCCQSSDSPSRRSDGRAASRARPARLNCAAARGSPPSAPHRRRTSNVLIHARAIHASDARPFMVTSPNPEAAPMAETRKIAAILVADVVGFSRLAAADEEGTLARFRALRGDLIDPAIAAYHGRTFKHTGDGSIIEFRSVVDAVRCAVEVQNGIVERNAGLPVEKRIEFRVGVHLGDVIEEADGDLMGDGVNVAARLEGLAEPGGVCLSEDAWRQVRDKLKEPFLDLGEKTLKNIARPMRVYALTPRSAAAAPAPSIAPLEKREPPRLSIVVLPFANIGGDAEQEHFVDGVTESLTTDVSRIRSAFGIGRNTAFTYKGKAVDLKLIGRELNVRYVLEGSVQLGGNRMRVNVQLIDAETGNHLWAERFDKPLADLFDMQDEIVARLAGA